MRWGQRVKTFRIILMTLGGMYLFGLASCAMLGVGAIQAVQSTDFKKLSKEHEKKSSAEELAEHNAEMNRLASYQEAEMRRDRDVSGNSDY